MGNGAPGGHRQNVTQKRHVRTALVLRFFGRLAAAAVAVLVFTLIAIQFARVIDQNVALASSLNATQADIASLQARRAWQLQQMRRLEDPEGALPEIHDRLRLVRPNEAIVFVSPLPSPSVSPAP
jgi:cell division protein FtsB